MRDRLAPNDPQICMNDEFFPRIFKSRKLGNDICFMTFFQISARKMSGEISQCNEDNTVKMIQMSLSVSTHLFEFDVPPNADGEDSCREDDNGDLDRGPG